MWDYVFSPRHMMFDAAAGLVFAILFRVFRGVERPGMLTYAAFMAIAFTARSAYLGGLNGRSIPHGYIGEMVELCLHESSKDECLCATDAVEADIGHPAVTQLAVKAGVNHALPPQFVAALKQCGS